MKILVSACLLGENCKYNGGNNQNDRLIAFLNGKEVIPVCPEQLGGLPVPRDCVEIVDGIPKTKSGVDCSEVFYTGIEEALAICEKEEVCFAILQSRSPTCGVNKRYDGTFTKTLTEKDGLFAAALRERKIPVFDVSEFLENLNKKTLFIADLDGTLLHSSQRTSSVTNQVINRLCGRGMAFSYATARSIRTAQMVTAGISAEFPVIVNNGAFVFDRATGECLYAKYFSEEERQDIFSIIVSMGVAPLCYAMNQGQETVTFVQERLSNGAKAFLDTRPNDPRMRPVKELSQCLSGDSFYFTCIDDDSSKVISLYEVISRKYSCVYYREIYSGDYWLEVMPAGVTKAAAMKRVKEMLACDRVVSFGDGRNDLSMFEASDECYAVANADDELILAATGVIPCNDRDAVAEFLSLYYEEKETK